MKDFIKIVPRGFKEVIEFLPQLGIKFGNQYLKRFNTKVAKQFLLDEVRSRTPYKPNFTKKFGGFEGFKLFNDRSDPTAVIVGPTRNPIVNWLEKGTKERIVRYRKERFIKPASRGSIKAQNYIEPIYTQQVEPMSNYYKEEMGNELNKFVSQKLKKYKK
jgi:hypothetical protein